MVMAARTAGTDRLKKGGMLPSDLMSEVTKACRSNSRKGGSGHLTVRRGDRKSQLPRHGKRKVGQGLG
jgi:hypothetical protein